MSSVALLLSGFLVTMPVALSASTPTDSAAFSSQSSVESTDEPVSTAGTEVAETDQENSGEDSASAGETQSRLDRQKQSIDNTVQRASLWVDSFFADPYNLAEATDTQFRIRPELYYRKEQGTKFRFRASVKIHLPGLGDRVSFIAGADEDSEDSGDDEDDGEDDSVLGLQIFLSSSRKWNTSLTAGVKFNSFAGFVGPRIRYQTAMSDNSSFRFTQTFRWQTNNYWDIGSRFDLNFILGERLYFRQTVYGRWRGEESDEEGYRTRISSILTQRLSSSAGLQYDFTTIFHTEPDTHVDKYTLALRYRKRTRREWLYYEIVPQVSFEDEFGYEFNPGIRLRLEIFFGGSKTRQFRKRTLEDDQDFRW